MSGKTTNTLKVNSSLIPRDESTEDLGTSSSLGGSQLKIKTDFDRRLEALEDVGIETVQRLLERFDLNMAKRKARSAEADLTPFINVAGKIVVLPASITDEDYHIGTAMIVLAHRLGFKIKKIAYKKSMKDAFTRDEESFAEGILIGCGDKDNCLNLTHSESYLELGRKYFRAIQVKRLIDTDPKFGPTALKRNHVFFGNNKSETRSITIGKKSREIIVSYVGSMLEECFREKEWSVQLGQILRMLIKLSATDLNVQVQEKDVPKSIKSVQDVIEEHCARFLTVDSGRGKKREDKVKKIPHKIRPSTLLTKDENKLVSEFGSSLYAVPDFAKNHESWYNFCQSTYGSYQKAVDELVNIHKARGIVQQRFAALTTKRLRDIRKMSDGLASIRKKDVKTETLVSFLSARKHPLNQLRREIRSLDPKNENQFFETQDTKLEITNKIQEWKETSDIYKKLQFHETEVETLQESEEADTLNKYDLLGDENESDASDDKPEVTQEKLMPKHFIPPGKDAKPVLGNFVQRSTKGVPQRLRKAAQSGGHTSKGGQNGQKDNQ